MSRDVKARAVPLLLLLAAAACGEGEAATTLTREQFVRANVAMRSVPDTAANARRTRLDSLARYRATPGTLRQYVRVHGGDLRHMASVYEEIANLVDQRITRRGDRSTEVVDAGLAATQDALYRDSIQRLMHDRAQRRIQELTDSAPPATPPAGGPPPGATQRPADDRPWRTAPPPPRNPPPPRTEAPRAMVKQVPRPAADTARPTP